MEKYDLIIIGGGAAGITAAVYGKRAGFSCLIIENKIFGGQMCDSAEIENFPPFLHISGSELAEKMAETVAEIPKVWETVTELTEGFIVKTDKSHYQSTSVVIANGVKRRKLNVRGEKEFTGRGVSYCAICDGNFFCGKTVCVVGGGNTAMEDAVYLAGICEKVYIIHRREKFRAQRYLVDKVKSLDNIEFIMSAEVSEILGSTAVEGVMVNGERLMVDGIFIAIGLEPQNQQFKNMVDLDERGYIIAGEDCKTSHKGIFCAGDTRTKGIRQIVTAMADGAVAISAAEKYIHGI